MTTAFVEEYRKELSATGYPFTVWQPLRTETNYSIPIGIFADASVYTDDLKKIPKWTSFKKDGQLLIFVVGPYTAKYDLQGFTEVIELYTEDQLFGGILVVNSERIAALASWLNGEHKIVSPPNFCLRCIEYIPKIYVQRLRADDGELFSGNVTLMARTGSIFQSDVKNNVHCAVLHFVGDPIYTALDKATGTYRVPIQKIVCSDSVGQIIELYPGETQDILIIACATQIDYDDPSDSPFIDALRINASGSSIQFSLAGL